MDQNDLQRHKAVYDDLYRSGDLTYERPVTSPYYPLFKKAVLEVEQTKINRVLEVGCGSGVLAELLIARGIGYRGFDFSVVGIEKAIRRNPGSEQWFWVGDATDVQSYRRDYDGIVCCEVLEHIEGDRDAVMLWKSGAYCVCSVPNFDYPTHVRFFRHENEIRRRYGDLISIERIHRIPKSASANLTVRAYLRRLRWARDKPKVLLGMLGINTFEWYSGWFLFVGRRR